MEGEPTASTGDNRQQDAIAAMREIISPLIQQVEDRRSEIRASGRPDTKIRASGRPDAPRPRRRPRKDAVRPDVGARGPGPVESGAGALELLPDEFRKKGKRGPRRLQVEDPRVGTPRRRQVEDPRVGTPGRRGPKTAAGRAAIAANALTHGLTSRQVTIPGLEDPEEFAAFRQGIFDDRQPDGAVEEALCERIAEGFWRLRRVAPYIASLIAIGQHTVERDYEKLSGGTEDGRPREEVLVEAIAAAQDVADCIGLTGEPHRRLSKTAGHEFAAVLLDEDEGLAHQPLAGFEEGIWGIPEDEWTVGTMSAAIRSMAEYLEVDVVDLAMKMHERLATRIDNNSRALAECRAMKDVMRRERQMPPAPQLLVLIKYEAHENRQLTQNLAQLESLQAYRNGRPIPTQVVHFSTGS
jgi:hypothetical protein